MFGCVVSRLGYSDKFQQQLDGSYVLSFPNSVELGNISVFAFDSSKLANCAIEVSVRAEDFYEKTCYLTESAPSATFVTGLERLNRTDLPFSLVLTPVQIEAIDHCLPYCPTDYELALLDRATQKMVDHFQRYMAPGVVEHEGQQYLSIKRAMAWQEAFLKESRILRTFWI